MTSRHHHIKRPPTPPLTFGYPSPAERQVIIQKRRQLSLTLMEYLLEDARPDGPRYQELVQQYGLDEVRLMLASYQKNDQEKNPMLDEPYGYRQYRQAFARFGGRRRFLSHAEHGDLQMEFMKMFVPRTIMTLPPIPQPSARETELYDLILTESPYWEDITPPAIPPRPAGYPFIRRVYPAPIQKLLALGSTASFEALAPQLARQTAADQAIWQPLLPDLLSLVFEPNLLHGWPADPSAWAPWHALHLLGLLQARSSATALLGLMDDPDDWLSDCLPAVWAKMGLEVQSQLWRVLDNPTRSEQQRSQICLGMLKLAETFPQAREAIVSELVERLDDLTFDNPTVIAFMVFTLNRLKATQALKVIKQAFKQKRVNTHVIELRDVQM